MPLTRSSKRKQVELEQELIRCATNGNLDGAIDLIQLHRVPVNCSCPEDDGETPLMMALLTGHDQIASFLLANGADVEAVDKIGDSALFYTYHSAQVELLVNYGANIEAVGHTHRGKACSKLGSAIYLKNTDLVRSLLQFGANTVETICQDKTQSALFHACGISNVNIVQLLLDHDDGMDVNSVVSRDNDHPAMSPLCEACRHNNLPVVELLIQNGAQVVHEGSYPDSPCPLKHAVEKGSLKLLSFLLDHSPYSVLKNENAIGLPETGGGGGVGDPHPLSPLLDSAIRWSKLQSAQLLLDHGANVNDGPFLNLCAYLGDLKGVRLLLRYGADVNEEADRFDGKTTTPIWNAAENGNVKMVQLFLEAQADVSIRVDGETPLGVAYRNGHKKTVYLLLRTSPSAWSRLKNSW